MKKITLKNISLGNTDFDVISVYIDAYNNLIFLPYLWSIYLYNNGAHWRWKIKSNHSHKNHARHNKSPSVDAKRTFEEVDINDQTVNCYANHLSHFLKYVEDNNCDALHNLSSLEDSYINNYLNAHLSSNLNSYNSLKSHKAALTSFYDFLYFLELRVSAVTKIYRKTKKFMAEKDCRPKKISYITLANRNKILLHCNTKRDRLLIRMGYEVGLRASECRGLVIKDFKYRYTITPGLKTLFKKLEENPNQRLFKFFLNGKYTKRGRSRNIYLERYLLSSLLDYYLTERKNILSAENITCNTLFVKNDYSNPGHPISRRHPSTIFREIIRSIPEINQQLTFHDLRHTFATELYEKELQSKDGRETRSESAALISVSQRLGHASPTTSLQYIEIRQHMLIAEEGENNGR